MIPENRRQERLLLPPKKDRTPAIIYGVLTGIFLGMGCLALILPPDSAASQIGFLALVTIILGGFVWRTR